MKDLFWMNKKVLITGHTGFKGSWLSIWLEYLGADVTGYSLKNESDESLFKSSGIEKDIKSYTGDICDFKSLKQAFEETRPEIVFHLAAQSLVIEGYNSPLSTYETNVVGTANVLECSRQSQNTTVVVNVTSDKCYENFEQLEGYSEGDRLGGFDPYSSSKACAELVASCYQNLYKDNTEHKNIKLVSVRAGNVIGGGDWSKDRLIPDIIRHIYKDSSLSIRNLGAVRPWQHVIEPLFGYMIAAKKLFNGDQIEHAYNFGPNHDGTSTVFDLIEMVNKTSDKNVTYDKEKTVFHETNYLNLNNSLAKKDLNWEPKWSIEETLGNVLDWYNAYYLGEDIKIFTVKQIQQFEKKENYDGSNDNN
ncbi:CDP-glucose 4,6-dehydratase [Gammaproteobacteria bacterium]|nr:CDP-glucose 4,6-dehydratase [Gammaproteobacteria bacterium]